MEEEEYAGRERKVLEFIKKYCRFFFLPLFIILFIGLVIPFGICNHPNDPEGNIFHTCLENLYLLSGWFYSWSALATFVAVVIGAILAYQQLRLLREDVKASSYSQLYSRLDTIHSLFIEHLNIMPRLKLDESELSTKAAFGFLEEERHICHIIFTNLENVYYQWKKFHVLDDDDWNAWKVSIKRTFAIPYISKYWEIEGHRGFTKEFQDMIDRVRTDDSI